MCNQSILNQISAKVLQAAKDSLGDKLDKVILFGSYARGDFSVESDIDIMVLADIPRENRGKERAKINGLLGYIDLDLDVVLSLSVVDVSTFNKFSRVEPLYRNVLKDGVVLSA